jgi:ferritin-like metal-binding protein YciE
MEEPQERLIRYLQDAHAAEVGIAGVLKDAVSSLNNEQARSLFAEHLAVTESQADRLEARLNALGSDTSGGKNFLNTLMGKISDLMNAGHDEYDKTTQDIIKAYSTEHLEIGMYTSMAAYAQAIGDVETATLAQEIMAEEEEAAENLYPLISQQAQATYRAATSSQTTAAA